MCWEVVITIQLFNYTVYCAGGSDGNRMDHIFQFDGDSQLWEEIGQLRLKRSYHAMSVINIHKIDAYLNCD